VRPGLSETNHTGELTMTTTNTQITVCQIAIQYDKSSVGHCWVAATEIDCPADIQEEIAGEIVDGKITKCSGFVATNAAHYRW